MIRRRVLVSGRVQGVFYRDTCREVAVAAGVTGWVRNLPDLRVEAVLEGSPEAVEGVVEWCRTGPPRAEVTGIEVLDEPPAGEREFRVVW
jgi:acylphosphatase